MTEHDIILFDGICNLCNGAVKFIAKRDRHLKFRFASLQSPFAHKRLAHVGLDPDQVYSIVLLRGDHYFQGSDAVLEITRKLDGLWPMLYAARIIPRFIREGMYKLIANNRYKLFGKKESCMIPTKELIARFIA